MTPLAADAWGHRLWSVPPNSQGYLTLAAAWIADGLPLPADPDDPAWPHLLIEAAIQAGHDRPAVLHDGAHGPDLVDAGRLGPRAPPSGPTPPAASPRPPAAGDTTYLCVVDGERHGRVADPVERVGLRQRPVPSRRRASTSTTAGSASPPRRATRRPTAPAGGRPTPCRRRWSPIPTAPSRRWWARMGGDAQPQILLQVIARWLQAGQSPGEVIGGAPLGAGRHGERLRHVDGARRARGDRRGQRARRLGRRPAPAGPHRAHRAGVRPRVRPRPPHRRRRPRRARPAPPTPAPASAPPPGSESRPREQPARPPIHTYFTAVSGPGRSGAAEVPFDDARRRQLLRHRAHARRRRPGRRTRPPAATATPTCSPATRTCSTGRGRPTASATTPCGSPSTTSSTRATRSCPTSSCSGCTPPAAPSDLRFGQMFNVVPQWHPLRLAEDFALADVLTGGRMEFGVGRGTVPREAWALGTVVASGDNDMSAEHDRINRETFEEAMEVIKLAWTQRALHATAASTSCSRPTTCPTAAPSVNDLTLIPKPTRPDRHLPAGHVARDDRVRAPRRPQGGVLAAEPRQPEAEVGPLRRAAGRARPAHRAPRRGPVPGAQHPRRAAPARTPCRTGRARPRRVHQVPGALRPLHRRYRAARRVEGAVRLQPHARGVGGAEDHGRSARSTTWSTPSAPTGSCSASSTSASSSTCPA